MQPLLFFLHIRLIRFAGSPELRYNQNISSRKDPYARETSLVVPDVGQSCPLRAFTFRQGGSMFNGGFHSPTQLMGMAQIAQDEEFNELCGAQLPPGGLRQAIAHALTWLR